MANTGLQRYKPGTQGKKSLEQKKGAEHAERQSNRTLGGKRLDEKEYLLYSHTRLDF